MGLMLQASVLLIFLLLQSGCGSYPKYPVNAWFLEESIQTTVDSKAAQYYLNHYLQGDRLDLELDREIDQVYQNYDVPLPTRDQLQQISKKFSNDFAALFLVDRLWDDERNRNIQRSFHRQLAKSPSKLFNPPKNASDYLILLVPGWNYMNTGHVTGSDFAAPRVMIDQLKIENELVPIPPTGSVIQSAEIIAQSILRHSKDDRKIIVVGASAAGPSIHYTLGGLLNHQQLGSVVAWVNLGGILQGSPLVDYFQKWPQKLVMNMVLLFWGWDNDEIMTMSAQQTRERTKTLELPPDMTVINYLGLSLTGDLSPLSIYKYPIIEDQGPNDGLTPLVDIIAPGSITLTATRSDHYFGQDPEIDFKTIAIVNTIIEIIEQQSR